MSKQGNRNFTHLYASEAFRNIARENERQDYINKLIKGEETNSPPKYSFLKRR